MTVNLWLTDLPTYCAIDFTRLNIQANIIFGAGLLYTCNKSVICALAETVILLTGRVAVFAVCKLHRPQSITYFLSLVKRNFHVRHVAVSKAHENLMASDEDYGLIELWRKKLRWYETSPSVLRLATNNILMNIKCSSRNRHICFALLCIFNALTIHFVKLQVYIQQSSWFLVIQFDNHTRLLLWFTFLCQHSTNTHI